MDNKEIIVVGGGPAGMMAASTAGSRGLPVTLLEKNQKLGKKLYLTGKGRCNITNNADMENLSPMCQPMQSFCTVPLHLTNQNLLTLLSQLGLKQRLNGVIVSFLLPTNHQMSSGLENTGKQPCAPVNR